MEDVQMTGTDPTGVGVRRELNMDVLKDRLG